MANSNDTDRAAARVTDANIHRLARIPSPAGDQGDAAEAAKADTKQRQPQDRKPEPVPPQPPRPPELLKNSNSTHRSERSR